MSVYIPKNDDNYKSDDPLKKQGFPLMEYIQWTGVIRAGNNKTKQTTMT